MKDIKGTIKFYNKNVIKKCLGTGALILVADVSPLKSITIISSIGAGLMIANIASKIKERKENSDSSLLKTNKRSIIIEKLKELKAELVTEVEKENSSKKKVETSTKKEIGTKKELSISNYARLENKPKEAVTIPSNFDLLGDYIARQKTLKK